MKILPVIVGAAGHVDHGKTSLVRLLSDRETDTLAEEKARGMSIDMSVVPLPLPAGEIVGLVDVPGHRDYIRNSVAGISAIDVLLLVVAADDGVMPQTIEHVKAAHYFGARGAVIAVNKVDLVDAETAELVSAEAEELVERFHIPETRVVRTSCAALTGIEEVRRALGEVIAQLGPPPPDNRSFRMSVRKAFPMRGLGTVMTGIPISGSVELERGLNLFPTDQSFTVKGIQQYRTEVKVAQARISTAINTRDVSAASLERGFTIAEPDHYRVVAQAYAVVEVCASKTELKSGARVLLHCGCISAVVQLRPIDSSTISEGNEAIVLVKFSEPVVITAGDRFILRNPARGDIIGGGRILSAGPLRVGKLTDELLELLLAAKSAVADNNLALASLLLSQKPILSIKDLTAITHCSPSPSIPQLRKLAGGTHFILEQRIAEVTTIISHYLKSYHQRNKLVWGARPELIAEFLQVPLDVFRDLLTDLSKRNSGFELKHGRVALSSFAPDISARDISLREKLLSDLIRREPPAVARGDAQKFLNCSEQEMKRIISLLVDEGELKVIGTTLMLTRLYDGAIELVKSIAAGGSIIELATFRERSGLSRNLAVAILDELDGRGVTYRSGNERRLRGTTT